MQPIIQILAALLIVFLLLLFVVMISRMNTQKQPERRISQFDRRRRIRAAKKADEIRDLYDAEAIHFVEAIHRMRESEIPKDASFRILR